ncbi:hypothetical protein AKG11_10830 [Shinella sp. SUS2]|nr:hypothetical protein AKG11_10830 [Shinella sp. SUS2]KOC73302.1 hypothetical protein AKG10_23130 [Shinella sp. GWS1]
MEDEVKDVEITLSALERRHIRRLQPELREAATQAGHHRTCRLPKCRRAKRCTGCHPADEIATTHYKTFPPCVHDDAAQARLLAGWRVLCDRDERAWLAAGHTLEALDRLGDERRRALEEDDDWPEDPLCPPPRNAVA